MRTTVAGAADTNDPDARTTIVCGTILLGGGAVEWRDLNWADIGNPDLNDIGARFRGVNDWAVSNGFAGGFPNMHHADTPAGRVAGAILVKVGAAEWRDVPLGKRLLPKTKDHVDGEDVQFDTVKLSEPNIKDQLLKDEVRLDAPFGRHG